MIFAFGMKLTIDERYKKVLSWFAEHHPEAETELLYDSPFGLLVAVVLSAQCTDKRVNLVTPELLMAFPDAYAMARADAETLFPYIRSVSYPNNKAKHLAGLARMLVKDFNGEVPSSREDLEKLPGVGRKTANVIASVIFNEPAMAVDTHVFRVSGRIGLTTRAKNPRQAEEQLMKRIPREMVARAHHWLILHGRYVCLARNPKCTACDLKDWCRFYEQNSKK